MTRHLRGLGGVGCRCFVMFCATDRTGPLPVHPPALMDSRTGRQIENEMVAKVWREMLKAHCGVSQLQIQFLCIAGATRLPLRCAGCHFIASYTLKNEQSLMNNVREELLS